MPTISYALLAQAALAADTDTDLYTVPVDNQAVVSVNLVNRAVTDVVVHIALAAGAVPTDAEWIEGGLILAANGGVVERTGLALQAGKHVVVKAAATGVSAAVWGMLLAPEV